jgi:phage terminase large subunit-like protein
MSEKVINQFAEFPYGDSDDLVDSSTQALIRFRQGGFIRLASDELEEDAPKGGPAPEYY